MKLLRFVIGAIGGFACLAGAVIALVAVYRSGWLERLLPRIGEPVKIELYGPGECLAGREYFFHVDVSEPHGPIVWKIEPDVPNALRVVQGNEKAAFMTDLPGQYMITVSVAGDGRSVSIDSLLFENLEINDAPASPAIDPMTFEALKAAVTPQPPPTIAERVRAVAAAVHSGSKADEARAIAGITRSIITRLRDGLIAPDADVVAELQTQVDLALGEHSRAWDVVIAEARAIVDDLRQHGHITTAASTQPTLTEIAAALDTVH